MSVKLWMVRHGQTELNLAKRVQGSVDSALTPLGITQAEAARDVLAGHQLDAVSISPYGRTRQTANIVLGESRGLARTFDARIREMNFGFLEGGPEQAMADYSDGVETFRQVLRGTYAGFPQGEDGPQLASRLRSFADSLLSERDNQSVLMVSHGIAISCLLATLAGVEILGIPNGCVIETQLELVDGEPRITVESTFPAERFIYFD